MITNAPFGSPVNFKVNVDQENSVNTDQGLYLHLDVRRSGAVRLLVIFIVLANCTSPSFVISSDHYQAHVATTLHPARACQYSVLVDNYRLIAVARTGCEGIICDPDRLAFCVYLGQIKYAWSACRIR